MIHLITRCVKLRQIHYDGSVSSTVRELAKERDIYLLTLDESDTEDDQEEEEENEDGIED